MQVIVDTTLKMGLTPEDDFILRVVQLSELLAIRHCVFLMGPTGSGRSECYKVLAKAIQTGTDKPVNTYLEACNRKKVFSSSLYVRQFLCTDAMPLLALRRINSSHIKVHTPNTSASAKCLMYCHTSARYLPISTCR